MTWMLPPNLLADFPHSHAVRHQWMPGCDIPPGFECRIDPDQSDHPKENPAMSTRSTPAEVAQRAIDSTSLSRSPREAAMRAVLLDRADRDLIALIAEALEDRASDAESLNGTAIDSPEACRRAAARLREDPSDAWETHVGPLLDSITEDLGASRLHFHRDVEPEVRKRLEDEYESVLRARDGDGAPGSGYDARDDFILALMRYAGVDAVDGSE